MLNLLRKSTSSKGIFLLCDLNVLSIGNIILTKNHPLVVQSMVKKWINKTTRFSGIH